MARHIREEPKASRPVSLYIGPSFEAAWEHVLLPWFETIAARAFENRVPVAVVTPFPEHTEGVGELLDRRVYQLHLATVRFISRQAEGGGDHLLYEIGVGTAPAGSDQFGDFGVELCVAGAVDAPALGPDSFDHGV